MDNNITVSIKKPSEIFISQLKRQYQRCFLVNENISESIHCFFDYLEHIKIAKKDVYKEAIGMMAGDYYKYIKLTNLDSDQEMIEWFEKDSDIDIEDIMLKIEEDKKLLSTIYKKAFLIQSMNDQEKYSLIKNVKRNKHEKLLSTFNRFYHFENLIDEFYNNISLKDELINYSKLISNINIEKNNEYCKDYINNIKKDNEDDYDNIIKQMLSDFYIWKKWLNSKMDLNYLEQRLINNIEKNDYDNILNILENNENTMLLLIENFIWYNTKELEVNIDVPTNYIKTIDKQYIIDKLKTSDIQKKKTL